MMMCECEKMNFIFYFFFFQSSCFPTFIIVLLLSILLSLELSLELSLLLLLLLLLLFNFAFFCCFISASLSHLFFFFSVGKIIVFAFIACSDNLTGNGGFKEEKNDLCWFVYVCLFVLCLFVYSYLFFFFLQ